MAEEIEETEDSPPKSKKGLIIAVVVAVVNIVLIGGGFFFLTGSKDAAADGDVAKSKKKTKSAATKEMGPLVNLDGFVVNLEQGERTRYLKTALTVALADEAAKEQFEKSKMLVRNEVLMYLSSLDIEKMKGVKQKKAIQSKLKKLINKRLKSDIVDGVYFTEFVTQ